MAHKRSLASRRSRAASKRLLQVLKEERAQQEHGHTDGVSRFSPDTNEVPCPDCVERRLEGYSDLYAFHQPKRLAIAPLSRSDARAARVPRANCETCKGAGVLSLKHPLRDPYSEPLSVTLAARIARRHKIPPRPIT